MAGRHKYTLEGDGTSDKKTTVYLKKWSIAKCLSLLKDVGEVAKALGEDFSFDGDMNAAQIAQLLTTLGEEAGARVTHLIHASICEPNLTEDDILEWTLEDYVGVLAAALEMNLTESLSKNYSRLKTAISSRMPQVKVGSNRVPASSRS